MIPVRTDFLELIKSNPDLYNQFIYLIFRWFKKKLIDGDHFGYVLHWFYW